MLEHADIKHAEDVFNVVEKSRNDTELVTALINAKNDEQITKILTDFAEKNDITYDEFIKGLLNLNTGDLVGPRFGGKKRKTTRNKKNKRKSRKLRRKSKRSN